jgi:hypothetical protein
MSFNDFNSVGVGPVISPDKAAEFYHLAVNFRLPIPESKKWEMRFNTRRWDGCRAAWAVFDGYQTQEGVIIPSVEEMLRREAWLNAGAQAIQDCGVLPLRREFKDGFRTVGGMLSGRCDLRRDGLVEPDGEWLVIQS